MEATIKVQLKQAVKTESQWRSSNPVIPDGCMAITSDRGNAYKVGDGSSKWDDLSYNTAEVDTWKTSGIWTYIKRADGTAECFTTTMYTLDNVDVNQGAWNGYVSNYIQLPSFPFSFTSIPHVTINTVVMDPGFHGDYMMIYNGIQTTEENTLKTYPPKFKYWRGSAITFGHPRVTCHAIGRWK